MKRQVLAKVARPLDEPRGPDVIHRLTVPASWFKDGACVELELPRNLSCAVCDGGGCEACGLAGAVSTRGRAEPPELVQLTLPRREPSPEAGRSTCVVRLTGHGGLPPADEALPRGHLLLYLSEGEATPGLVRLEAPCEPDEVTAAAPGSLRRVAAALVVLVVALVGWWLLGR
ncbi:MAG: hypothetical protein KIT72_04070 [Polyangiaceae bacterium]|nr:hypothetical protein [Polyangiaceae bacterium]MCW5789580.1 hypothetical protein [Polyangiaceae bacterium]